MDSKNLCKVLYQVPASLLFKKKNDEKYFASEHYLKSFETTSISTDQAFSPQFLDVDSREPLSEIPESCFNSIDKQTVLLKSASGLVECQIDKSTIGATDSDWIVLSLVQCQNRAAEQKFNADETYLSADKHISFNQLLSVFSSKLINANSQEIDTIIDKCLAAFGEFCSVDRCYLFQFTADQQSMTNTHEWVAGGVTPYIDDLQELPASALPYFVKQIRKGVFRVADINDLPDEASLERTEFERESIYSVLCVPIYVAGKIFGFIGCDMVAKYYVWEEHDVDYLTCIGEMLGNTIENMQNRNAIIEMQAKLVEANKKLEILANIDGLTGLANRRFFDNTLRADIQRCFEQQSSLSLLMLDVDSFKQYNDEYGHLAGDQVIREIARVLKASCIGNDDLVARYGGEEFAIILPNTNTQMALDLAARIQRNLNDMALEHKYSEHEQVITVSIGVSTQHPQQKQDSLAMIDAADKALYRAKLGGKNRACL